MKFLPGPGLGGHCIPVELATEINGHMPRHVAGKVAELLNEGRLAVNGSRVLVLGVAYKPNVSDMRESPALDVIALLAARGAEISYHDPHVPEIQVEGVSYKSVDLTPATLSGADIAVVLTDHEGVDWEQVVAHAPRIFDTRNATRDVAAARGKVRKL
jgi:UDP-N-acetyl-D-glucosamine dehydrogenase